MKNIFNDTLSIATKYSSKVDAIVVNYFIVVNLFYCLCYYKRILFLNYVEKFKSYQNI